MKKLFPIAAILMTSLILGPTLPSTTAVARFDGFKAQVPKRSLIILAAKGSRECRDNNGDGHNCAD
jgi:hypothetical protein